MIRGVRTLGGRSFLIVALTMVSSSPIASEQLNPALINGYWKAEWVTCPGLPKHDPGLCYLRKSFTVAAVPQSFVVHVSADNRYQLFVNGTRVSRGLSAVSSSLQGNRETTRTGGVAIKLGSCNTLDIMIRYS